MSEEKEKKQQLLAASKASFEKPFKLKRSLSLADTREAVTALVNG